MGRVLPGFTRRRLLAGTVAAGGLAVLGKPQFLRALEPAQNAPGGAAILSDLAELLRGELITPADASYDAARQVWNGMIDKRPAAIARCTGAADVIETVRYARANGLPVSVRGGGHSVAGKALRDDAITIDLGPMQGIRVDPAAKRARVQGGVRWGALDHETVAHDLVTTGGTVSTTGVAGLTLGGGLGWLMRKHGLACDNLVAADVVTADGRLLIADDTQNSDLLWALRGGGGNFGVVTSFEFQLHDLEPIVGGLALYPRHLLKDLFHFYRDYCATAPDSVTAQAGVTLGAAGSPMAGQPVGWFGVCHCGPRSEGERLVAPIKTFGPPTTDLIGPMSYKALQTMFDAGLAGGQRSYWRSNFMKKLGDATIDTIVAHADELPPPGSLLLFEHLGGAVGRVGEHETAFANRGAQFNVSVLSTWLDPAHDEQNIAWTRELGDELRTHSTGGAYVNYMPGDTSPEQIRAAYEANYQRLVEVKRKYDPENFFSGNLNIAP